MAWSAPIAPVTGTVITVAWASANVVTPITWLRAMTGNADPPQVDYVVASTSTTATAWSKITRNMITAYEQLAIGMTIDWPFAFAQIPVAWAHFTTSAGRFHVNLDGGATFTTVATGGGSITNNLEHSHGVGTLAASGAVTGAATGGSVASGGGSTAAPTGHTHTAGAITLTGSTGATASASLASVTILPPWYAVYKIYKALTT